MRLAAASWEWLPVFGLAMSGKGEAFTHIWLKYYLDVGYKGMRCMRRY